MKLASVDAVSELVWSPLRCADFSFTGKPQQLLSPNIFHHIGQHTTQQGNQAWVEDMKTGKEETEEDKVETNDVSEEAGSSKRCLGENDCIKLRVETVGSQEEETNIGDNRVLNAERLEATDENDLTTPDVEASNGECLPLDSEKARPSGSYDRLAKAKGKEKALSDGRNNEEGDDEESFVSVESCNSAGLLLRGKKRPGFEQQLILGSKRLKTLSQESLGSTSKLKQDSSFMNWISNMTKGIWKGNEEGNSPSYANGQGNAILDQQEMTPKENSGCRNTGFQSFFLSIYCPKERDEDANVQELPWIPEQCLSTKRDHLSSFGPVAEPDISSGNKLEDKEPNISLLYPSKSKPSEEQKTCGEKVTQCLASRNSGLESLWINRFSSKPSFPQKKDLYGSLTNEVATDANDSSSDAVKTHNAILPIASSLRVESSEAMASLFARRLEAMKHIMPSGSLDEKAEEGQSTVICFYCGKKGHRLQDCLEVTDSELRDLVHNISARDGKEEATSLCIRCFQLTHWAATCPNAPLYSPGADDRAMKHAFASTSGAKIPFCCFTDVPKGVFDAVQVLRLTRTDVLKWINTKKSVLGLEGFFLRLRLGKWEEGFGGTGYHVARIEGATEGQSSRKHSVNISIPVKVGGMTCFVESQFVSNHDFLEEELKPWWRRARKSDGKSGGDSISLAEELCRKVQQKKMLGF